MEKMLHILLIFTFLILKLFYNRFSSFEESIVISILFLLFAIIFLVQIIITITRKKKENIGYIVISILVLLLPIDMDKIHFDTKKKHLEKLVVEISKTKINSLYDNSCYSDENIALRKNLANVEKNEDAKVAIVKLIRKSKIKGFDVQENVIYFTIRGVVDNSYGIAYSKDGKYSKKITNGVIIEWEKIEENWYFFTTT